VVVAVGIAGFMVWGPLDREVFGGTNLLLRPWDMYNLHNYNVCSVNWSDVESGTPVLLHPESMRALRSARHRHAWVTLQTKPRDVLRVAKLLCRARGPAADVRAQARCSSGDAWTLAFDGSEPLCRTPTPEKAEP
jgi:hypothetical protein